MPFVFSTANIKENRLVFIYEECAYPGVRKIAGRVREDIKKVFGAKPIGVEYADFNDTASFFEYPVFFGTVGTSAILDMLSSDGKIDLSGIAHHTEVYSINIIDGLKLGAFSFASAIVIAGSDKRGTIYGLFALSELLGVSPLTDWLGVAPPKLSELVLTRTDSVVSKTPSVKFRGFFINDEWPAFGNWCKRNYGGFTVKAYSKVFELLLRLKGNILWPAMWSSVFSEDGPGQASCVLADELGVIMGTSHHEPCMRQGEEYSHVRGKDSVYGDAWDFLKNPDGITRFWKDGIEARAKYENMYTVGMRGENDTAIMEKGSTMGDNIALLRNVIKTQNTLLAEVLGKDISDIPRVLALYKEVEPFWYGDDTCEGLMNDPDIDGVTVLFSDDNFGNLRRVPAPDERGIKGGYGIYYHLDYHGWPISYEWFNTSYLPKIWEQMSSAYDNGIRDLWIVNVGDIFTNEYPMSFFLDMAYDFERWGTSNKNSAAEYTQWFVRKNFTLLPEIERSEIAKLLLGYTKITSRRRTEAMNDDVYAPFTYGESAKMIYECEHLMNRASSVYKNSDDDTKDTFYQLVYLPLTGCLNVQKMWLLAGMNHAYAAFGSTYANTLAHEIQKCIKKDRKLVEKLHGMHKGKWYGMGASAHIGFSNWCEEECTYPLIHTVEPVQKKRLIVCIPSTGEHTEGGFWSGKPLTLPETLDPLMCGGFIELSTASAEKVSYHIECDNDYIDVMDAGKSVKCGSAKKVFIFVDRMKLEGAEYAEGLVRITSGEQKIDIIVPVYNPAVNTQNTGTYMSRTYISMNAAGFETKKDTDAGRFEIIEGYGRGGDAIKAYPQNVIFTEESAPSVTYSFTAKGGAYVIRLYTSPANPGGADNNLFAAIGCNGGSLRVINMIPDGYAVGDGNDIWGKGVLDNVHIRDIQAELSGGVNTLTISARSPGFVLEKIVIFPEGEEMPYSYLGPPETFRT